MTPEHRFVYLVVVHRLWWGQLPFDDEWILEWPRGNFSSIFRKGEVRFRPVAMIGAYQRRTFFKKAKDVTIVWVDV